MEAIKINRYARFVLLVTIIIGLSLSVKLGLANADSGVAVSGTVLFGSTPAPANVSVTLHDVNTNAYEYGHTDSDGHYSILNVPEGAYGAYITNNGNGGGATPSYFNVIPQSSPITVSNSDLTQDFVFNTNTVAVTVKDSSLIW
jgi:hypothetical protein